MNSASVLLSLASLMVGLVYGHGLHSSTVVDVEEVRHRVPGVSLSSHPTWSSGPDGISNLSGLGVKMVNPIYSSPYSSPLVADARGVGEGGVVVTRNVVNGADAGNMGIFVTSAERGNSGMTGQGRLISLHHLIHHAKQVALNAKLRSSDAELKSAELLALNKALEAKLKSNEAEMLEEEEKKLLAQRTGNPEILVKDTIPVANVANNTMSFEHHNELLKKRLEMINNDQKNAVRRSAEYARLHKARTSIQPDSLAVSDPRLFSEFITNGPAANLTFEVPIDPSSGKYYISTNPGESFGSKRTLTSGDLPYFAAHHHTSR